MNLLVQSFGICDDLLAALMGRRAARESAVGKLRDLGLRFELDSLRWWSLVHLSQDPSRSQNDAPVNLKLISHRSESDRCEIQLKIHRLVLRRVSQWVPKGIPQDASGRALPLPCINLIRKLTGQSDPYSKLMKAMAPFLANGLRQLALGV